MGYRTLMILISLLLLVACGSAQETPPPATPAPEATATQPPPAAPTATQPPAEPPTPTATVAVEEQAEPPSPTAIAEAEPTETPQPEPTPTEIAPEPTPAEIAPEPTPTIAPTATPEPEPEPPAPQAGGLAGFRNNLATADRFVLELTALSMPPGGQIYQGWLISDDGAMASLGALGVNSDGSVALEWNSPNSENLLSRYSRFQATLEPAAGSNSPTGPLVLVGGLEGDALANARRLFVKNEGQPATPLDTAFALGLMAQTDVAVQHTQNAVTAAAIGALSEMRAHLEHMVNITEGASGPRFGDHDGNGNAENPGDGFGVVGYAGQIANLFANRPAVVEAATGVQAQSAVAQDKSFEILQLQDIAAANAQIGELKGLVDQLKAGPVAGLYQAAQNAAGFEVTAVE